jgi:hypothetical protein
MDIHAHALARVREILGQDSSALISPEVDARIRAEFNGLIPGNLEMPEGWQTTETV